jgi:hypothetical protein
LIWVGGAAALENAAAIGARGRCRGQVARLALHLLRLLQDGARVVVTLRGVERAGLREKELRIVGRDPEHVVDVRDRRVELVQVDPGLRAHAERVRVVRLSLEHAGGGGLGLFEVLGRRERAGQQDARVDRELLFLYRAA